MEQVEQVAALLELFALSAIEENCTDYKDKKFVASEECRNVILPYYSTNSQIYWHKGPNTDLQVSPFPTNAISFFDFLSFRLKKYWYSKVEPLILVFGGLDAEFTVPFPEEGKNKWQEYKRLATRLIEIYKPIYST